MSEIVISGTGIYIPPEKISNQELVEAYNAYADKVNEANQDNDDHQPLMHSDAEFIERVSGIKTRHVMVREGILDIDQMSPLMKPRPDDQPSYQCEMALAAAKQAMNAAGKTADDIDSIIFTSSILERPFPSMAIEVQHFLGVNGFAFDMCVACASVTFAIENARGQINNGSAKCVLIVNPELNSPGNSYRDRDSHFIFGDAASAMIIEGAATATSNCQFEVVDTALVTKLSYNIRSRFSYLYNNPAVYDQLFEQEGRKVFKDVTPIVIQLISSQLLKMNIDIKQIRRLWFHQANATMNRVIASKVLGEETNEDLTPTVLDKYGNTASSGSIIAFHEYHDDVQVGELGIICAFGAGYSAGSILIKRVK